MNPRQIRVDKSRPGYKNRRRPHFDLPWWTTAGMRESPCQAIFFPSQKRILPQTPPGWYSRLTLQ
ncbi:hypothetical protein BF29_1461 [Heyndrickxia coagulans DSM 1 = ATCC 7050]|nr:hypothetical protein BF29_1461 [Heyndrickxia coagulans DSM 1 = ATCC 7050]